MSDENKHYVYLVRNKDSTKFKIGYTKNNPRIRLKQYISHNPDIVVCGYWRVRNKEYEKYIQTELKLQWFKPCLQKGQKEWFEGSTDLKNIDSIIEKINTKSIN